MSTEGKSLPPVAGDTVRVHLDPFQGLTAMVRSVLKNKTTISVAFRPDQLSPRQREGLVIDPQNGMYNYILNDGEYEVLAKKRIFH